MLNLVLLLLLVNIFCKSRINTIIVSMIIIIIFGTRYDMGIDYLAYRKVFYLGTKTRFEFGYLLLSNIVKMIGHNFTILVLIMVLLQILFFGLGLKKRYKRNVNYAFGYFFLFTDKIFFTFLNTIRFGTAVCVFFLASYYYKTKQKIKFFFIIFLGSLFHRSIIITIPLIYLIDKVKIKKKTVIWIFLITILSLNIDFISYYKYIYPYIPKKYSAYNIQLLRTYENQGLSVTGLISTIIKMFIFIFVLNPKEKLSLEYKMAVFGLVLRALSMKNFIFVRIGGFFDIYFILLLVDYMSRNFIKTKEKIKLIIPILILIFFSITYLKTANFENPQNKLKYKNILFENPKYK